MGQPTTILLNLLNHALQLEIAAEIQYRTHAVVVKGKWAPGTIMLLNDSADDEAKHAKELRNIIGNYLDRYPTMDSADTQAADEISAVIDANIEAEQAAIDHYTKVLKFLDEKRADFPYYEGFREEIRLILVEEIEHQVELKALKDGN